MNKKIKEKIVLFAVLVDEKVKSIKPFIVKYKLLVGISIIALIGLCINTPSETQSDEIKHEEAKPNIKVEEKTKEKESHEGYKVLNKDQYQRGVDYYYNTTRKEKELWEMQLSVPYLLGNEIKETAKEKGMLESDVADYFYAGITSILEETRENLQQLKTSGADGELIECESKILKFIEEVHKNYSIDFTLPKEKEEQYLNLFAKKKELINKSTGEVDNKIDTDEEEEDTIKNVYLNMKFGTFEEAIQNGDTLVVKAKITPSYSNSATINQNNFNVEDIIKNQGGDKYNEIQYWAIADMEDGSESKVVSFTIDKNTINLVANGSIPGNMIMDHATDVWVLPSLLK